MSFDLRELSRWLGKPVELYRFTRQGLAWRYTSADQEVTVGGETFAPINISRDNIRESYEKQKRQLVITLPLAAEVCANWLPFSPEDTIAVTVLSLHRGDTETAVQWVGRVLQPKFLDTTMELTCTPGSVSNRPRGLQLKWQRNCPLPLYSQGNGMCNLDPEGFRVDGTISSVSGNIVSAPAWAALPTGRLAGGFIQWTAPNGLVLRRSILGHTGANLTLHYAADISNGDVIAAYHGCAHNFDDCASKGNGVNYGGCTQIPIKNPFSGNPIW